MRGFGVFIAPLLTIVILLWIFGTIRDYVLEPLESATRNGVAFFLAQNHIYYGPQYERELESIDGRTYRRMSDESYVPEHVYEYVKRVDGEELTNRLTGRGLYRRYVEVRYLSGWVVLPIFIVVFIPAFYLLGRFVAAGLGRYMWDVFERIVQRVPLVRNVYTSVRQVTDFMFNQRDLEYTRVVAVEYPRKGTWSLGFVTGESLLDIREAAAEPILAVLIPTSPMPVTGFTVTVLKSETVDLRLTVDQALEYIVSCGVVVPPHQLQTAAGQGAEPPRQDRRTSKQLTDDPAADGDGRDRSESPSQRGLGAEPT